MSKAASYSRVSLYEKCPASYEWQYVLGHKEDFLPGPAAVRGLEIHQSIEDFYNTDSGLHEEIPLEIGEFIARHKDVEGWEARPEMKFAFTKDWEPTGFDDEDAYIRGLMDGVFLSNSEEGVVKVEIDEYKTGRIYDDHANQKQLYAMSTLILFPEISSVCVTGVYIDKKQLIPTTYSRVHLTSMKFVWSRKVNKLHLPLYPARPGMHCRWCPKSSVHKEGPCQLG